MNKKEHERRKRERADIEKNESKTRKNTIKELLRTIEELMCGRQVSLGILATAKDLAHDWKIAGLIDKKTGTPRSFAELTQNELHLLLAGLVVELRREIKSLTQFRQLFERMRNHCPNELERLSNASIWAEARAIIQDLPKPAPKKLHEWKRSRSHWAGGEIERQFGGALQAELQKHMLLPDSTFVIRPDCLDDIFAGGRVNMIRLQELFGIDRHRFKGLLEKRHDGVKGGRKPLYDYRDVVMIMDALLSQRRRKRNKSGPGRPRRLPWLDDPDLRKRVLCGIEERIKSISIPEQIASAFLALVRPYVADSGKK